MQIVPRLRNPKVAYLCSFQPGAASSPGKSGGRAEVIRVTGQLLPSPNFPKACSSYLLHFCSHITFSTYKLNPFPSAAFASFQLNFTAFHVTADILYSWLIYLIMCLCPLQRKLSSLTAGNLGLLLFTAILPAPGIMPGVY